MAIRFSRNGYEIQSMEGGQIINENLSMGDGKIIEENPSKVIKEKTKVTRIRMRYRDKAC